jgi:hypothetical protein
MAEEKKSIVESKLNPLNHLDPFITGVASSTVFDSDLFFRFQFMQRPHLLGANQKPVPSAINADATPYTICHASWGITTLSSPHPHRWFGQ